MKDLTVKNVKNIIFKSLFFKRVEGNTNSEYAQQVVLGIMLWLVIGALGLLIAQTCGVNLG